MSMMKKWLSLLLALILSGAMLLTGCSELGIELDDIIALSNQAGGYNAETEILPADEDAALREDGHYSSKEEVGLYLYLYGKLPGNYITKNDAYDLGWDNKKGNLWEVAPGMSIGGDKFGNREGILPSGKQYYECDVNYQGGYRGSEPMSREGYKNSSRISRRRSRMAHRFINF